MPDWMLSATAFQIAVTGWPAMETQPPAHISATVTAIIAAPRESPAGSSTSAGRGESSGAVRFSPSWTRPT
ncbi:MAG TPA: hypothetical protein VGC56_01100 [Allosphingosinicella sp.]